MVYVCRSYSVPGMELPGERSTKAAGWICPGKVEFAMPWLQACELDPKDCVLSSLAPAILLMVIGVCKSEKSAFRGTPIPGFSPVRGL